MIARMVGGASPPVNATGLSRANRFVLKTALCSRARRARRVSPWSVPLADDGSSDLTVSSGGLC